jgi:DNA repair protein RadD
LPRSQNTFTFQKMYNSLSLIPPDNLIDAVGAQRLKEVARYAGTSISELKASPAKLVSIVTTLVGGNLLASKPVRLALLKTLNADQLRILASKYTAKPFDKPFDNAIALSNLSYKVNSPFLAELIRITGIGGDYLPASDVIASTLEELFSDPISTSLFDHQERVVNRVMELLVDGLNRLLIQMPTGSGKTRAALNVLLRLDENYRNYSIGPRFIWVAPTEELLEQAIVSFKRLWSRTSENYTKIIRFYGSRNLDYRELGGACVFSTYQKLYSIMKDSTVSGDLVGSNWATRILILDEAHRVVAPTFRLAIDQLMKLNPKTILLGLSATPGRTAGESQENIELAAFFDGNIVQAFPGENEIEILRERGILSRLSRKEIAGSHEHVHLQSVLSDDLISSRTLLRLSRDTERNLKILEAVGGTIENGHRVLVFACTVDHARAMAAALQCKGIRAVCVDALTSSTSRRDAVNNFRNGLIDVLTNYSVFATGFDAPGTDCVTIARPTTSIVTYSQMIGRGLRGPAVGGVKECLLIDIRDNFDDLESVDDVYSFFERYWK